MDDICKSAPHNKLNNDDDMVVCLASESSMDGVEAAKCSEKMII